MTVHVITMADTRFAELAIIGLKSVQAWGGLPEDARLAVYDFGLNESAKSAINANGIEVRRIIRTPYPAASRCLDMRLRIWLDKTALIQTAGASPDDDVIFFDSDMVINPDGPNVDRYIPAILEMVENHPDGPIATRDMPYSDCNFYARRMEDAVRPEFWEAWFGVNLCGKASWNIGLLAGRSGMWADVCPAWQHANYRWITDAAYAEAVSPMCVDQLTFSALAEKGEIKATALPAEFNVTRLIWTQCPEIIPHAMAVHMTGPIKPWQDGGRIHPLTDVWRRAKRLLTEGGQ